MPNQPTLSITQCELEFAQLPTDQKQWIICVVREMRRAEEKHPEWPEDIVHAAAIVAEESGELVRAAVNCYYENEQLRVEVAEEAVQTAATCLRLLNNIIVR